MSLPNNLHNMHPEYVCVWGAGGGGTAELVMPLADVKLEQMHWYVLLEHDDISFPTMTATAHDSACSHQ